MTNRIQQLRDAARRYLDGDCSLDYFELRIVEIFDQATDEGETASWLAHAIQGAQSNE